VNLKPQKKHGVEPIFDSIGGKQTGTAWILFVKKPFGYAGLPGDRLFRN